MDSPHRVKVCPDRLARLAMDDQYNEWLKETEPRRPTREWVPGFEKEDEAYKERQKAEKQRKEFEAWIMSEDGIKYHNELFFSGHD